MSDEPSAPANLLNDQRETVLDDLRRLGTSPTGESFLVERRAADDTDEDAADAGPEQLVLKKITRARLRAPERFRQKFEALCRLEHRGLCPYCDLYIGESTTRITRDFIAGMALDEYLQQPITDDESRELANASDDPGESDEIREVSEALPTSDQTDKSSPQTSDETDPVQSLDAPHEPEAPHEPQNLEPQAPESQAPTDPADESNTTDQHQDQDQLAEDRPTTLEIPESLLEDSEAADRALDLIILRLRRIIPQLVAALEYLHRYRQVHGHLTPKNIIITADDAVRLTDYGLHPELEIPADSRQRHANYNAPEVEAGEFSPRTDLYSLGAILFEALAGCPYGKARAHGESRASDDDARAQSPMYLSEITPHCPATWVDLIHGLLATDPDDRPPLEEVTHQLATTETRSVNIPASVISDHSDTLHGRHENLEFLADLAQQCSRSQTMGIATVEGETGVGKTAVLDALARWAAQRGWVVLQGRCYHHEPIAYQGWEEVVDRLAHIADNLPEKPRRRLRDDRRRAARIFPQLATDVDPPTDISRRAAVDGFRRFLARLSEQRPILICFDDVHWAGPDSVRLLADLAEHPQGTRLMIAATWHPAADAADDDHPFWRELATAPIGVERVAISGFSHQEARDYVIEHADHFTLQQKQEVLRRGGLNPLLIDELIHELEQSPDASDQIPAQPHEGGSGDPEAQPRRAEDHAAAVDESANDKSAVDENGNDVDHHLRTFIAQRLANLDRAQRLVLQLLAIASSPLSADLLSRAVARELGAQRADTASGQEIAESLVSRRLARRARHLDTVANESARYVIIHDLCRRVILDEVGQDHHARLAGLVADALGGGQSRADDLRFEYLQRAGRREETHRAAILAARAAVARFAFHRAAQLWHWLSDRDALEEEDRSHFALSLLGSSRFEQALEQLADLLPDNDRTRDLRLRLHQVDAHLGAGDRRAAVDALDDALEAAGWAYQSPSLVARLVVAPRRLLASTRRWADVTNCELNDAPADDDRAAIELLDRGLQALPFLNAPASQRLELPFTHQAWTLRTGPLLAQDRLHMIGSSWLPFLSRHTAKTKRWVDQAMTLSRRHDAPATRARALEQKALMARHHGQLNPARRLATEALELLESGQVSQPLLHARQLFLLVDIHLWRGDPKGADHLLARLTHRTRHRRWLTTLADLATCDRDLWVGDLDSAALALDRVEEFIGDDRNCLLHLWLMARRTRLDIAWGRPEVSVAHWDLLLDRVYSRGLRRHPAARYLIHSSLACALAALSERQRALAEGRQRQTLGRLRRTLRHLSDLMPWLGVIDAAGLLRLKARYAILRDRAPRALNYLDEATQRTDDELPDLVQALNLRARAVVLDALESPEARTTAEHAQRLIDDAGVYLPLVLEGWPVPAGHTRLKADP